MAFRRISAVPSIVALAAAVLAVSLCWAAPVAAQQGPPVVNLAKGKKAAQSSDGYGAKAEYAVDGSTVPDFSAKSTSHTADGDPMPWWEVDLGAVYRIQRIRVVNRTDCCRERLVGAQVIVSDRPLPKPNGMLAQRKRVYALDSVRHAYELPGDGVPVRFVRVQMLKPGLLHLSEVEVFGVPTPVGEPVAGTPGTPPEQPQLVNLAQGKKATQSSDGYGGRAAAANDGDKNPNFHAKSVSHTADNDKQPWWEVDLGAVYKVVGVRVYNRTDCCTERLAAGGAVVIVSDRPFPNPNGMASQRKRAFPIRDVKAVYDFPTGGMPARFVRVQMQKPGFLHLAEVEVIGEPKPVQPAK